MNFFKNFNKKDAAARLARSGIVNGESVSSKEIADCIYLLANATGELWKKASQEAAAGMVLIVLARDAGLANYLNSSGWKLVLGFINSNPDIAVKISPRTMGEILSYQSFARRPMVTGLA